MLTSLAVRNADFIMCVAAQAGDELWDEAGYSIGGLPVNCVCTSIQIMVTNQVFGKGGYHECQ